MSDKNKGRADDEFEDLDFGSFEPGAPAEPPPAGGDFDFDMPDPGRPQASAAAPAASPEDDFADLGAFGEPEHEPEPVHAVAHRAPVDDFGLDDVEEPRRTVSLGKPSARAASALSSHDDEDRPFGDEDEDHPGEAEAEEPVSLAGDDEEEETEAPARRPGFDTSKLIMPVAGTLSAALIAFMGWTYFLSPIFGSSDAAPPTGPLSVVAERAPTVQNGGMRQTAGLDAPLPSATTPGLTQPTTRAPFPDSGQRPMPAPQPQQPVRVQEAAGAPAATAFAKPDPAADDRIRQLQARIELLERQPAPSVADAGLAQKVRQLEERLAMAESRSVPAAPKPDVAVPYKPQVIDGWSLQGVNRDVAWVQGPKGLMEVREGDDLGSAGKVMGIQKYKKDFIVVTSVGVIMRS